MILYQLYDNYTILYQLTLWSKKMRFSVVAKSFFAPSIARGLRKGPCNITPEALKRGACNTGTSSITHFSRSARGYSTNVSKVSDLLNSKVSFRLANGLFVGMIGTLILYAIQKRRKKKAVGRELHVSSGVNRFTDKTVVITGGAGDIGMNAAVAFAREDASLFIVDLPRTEEDLKKKCRQLREAGAKSAEYVVCDVTNDEDVKRMVKEIADKTGHIDIFFNNAGIQGALKPLHKQDDKEFKKVIDVNIFGVFLGMKYVSQAMMESKRGGVIINTASVAGLLGPANMAAYAASKFAVVGMTKTAAKDLARYQIRVCAIAPGILEGKMWGTQVQGNAKCRKELHGDETEVSEEDFKAQEMRMIAGTPLMRQGKLNEVASVVTFLCSEDASYLTGITVPIDGGRIP